MIHLQNLSCRLGAHTALHSISTTLNHGCVALLGPNGAGKSTLLRLCADGGHCFPHAHITGDILLNGTPIKKIPPEKLAQQRAFLPQQHAEQLHLPVSDVLKLSAWPHNISAEKIRTLYEHAIAIWDLSAQEKKPYNALSGGERQRVQLARTWLQIHWHTNLSECVWLLDEPQNSLDLPQQQRLQQQLRAASAAGALVIFSTHDINFALRCADKILLLKSGTLHHEGTAESMANPTVLQQVFGVSFDQVQHPSDKKPWLLPR